VEVEFLGGVVMRPIGCVLLTALVAATLQGQRPGKSVEEYPTPLIRERQVVRIGSTSEVWELRWKATPKPACEARNSSLTVPCMGFAFGEGDELSLVRSRSGLDVDSLELTPFFMGADVNLGGIAIVQRWEPDYKRDFQASSVAGFVELVARRPTVKVMEFADYDHDGEKSVFFLQTDTLPGGKRLGIVIGISRSDSKLHAFGTAATPSRPVALQHSIWEALRRARGWIEVVDWACGDHGSEEETTVVLKSSASGITGVRRTYGSCPRIPGQRPTSEEPL
jgi:hypothetical protein